MRSLQFGHWINMKIVVGLNSFLIISLTFFSFICTHKINEPGDILLGGLFPIHQKGTNASRCGRINRDRGIQRVEAMLFAIEKINRDPNILGDMKLGAIILDTCSSDSYALNQSLEFIRASINAANSSAFECHDGSTPRPKGISGVVGPAYSGVSVQVANLLRLFKIPQVSYSSTGTSLSDKTRYDFFARTVPPDTYQALALVDLVQLFNWSYVSLVTSEGQYGDSGMNAFIREARHRNICIAVNERVPHSADENHFNEILFNLIRRQNARGVVLFLRAEDIRRLLEAAQALNLANYFTWIASDGWGKQEKLMEGVEEAAEGAITVELQSKEIEEFDYYMGNLTAMNHTQNPWFQEYWEDLFSCKLTQEMNDSSTPLCDPDLRINKSMEYKQESKVQFVVDAVYSFAYAVHRAWVDLCSDTRSYCHALQELDGYSFYTNYLLNVSFTDMAGNEMKFDKNGDRPGRYNIFNYQKRPNSSEYQYTLVGQWTDSGLELNQQELKFNGGSTQVPISICSHPCRIGEIKLLQHGDHCCWICNKCQPHEYVFNEFTCMDCGEGRWPREDKASCFDLLQQNQNHTTRR